MNIKYTISIFWLRRLLFVQMKLKVIFGDPQRHTYPWNTYNTKNKRIKNKAKVDGFAQKLGQVDSPAAYLIISTSRTSWDPN